MKKFYAHTHSNSTGRTPYRTLKADNLTQAKRESRRLLGDGYLGHKILISEVIDGQRLEVACATIGETGWTNL